ncbi:MAG: hypothetical protein U0640_13865 [Phycisphaerales bacterium]
MSDVTAAKIEPFVLEYYRLLASDGKITANLIEPQIGSRPGNVRLLLGIPLLACPPIGIHLIIRHFVVKSQHQKMRDNVMRAATSGKLRSMTPIMINSAFLDGSVPFAPGLFLGIADEGPALPEQLAEQLEMMVSFSGDDDKDYGPMLKDQNYVRFRRRFAPTHATEGRKVATFDIFLYRQRFSQAGAHRFEYYAMVQPGESGNVAFMVPDSVIEYAKKRAEGKRLEMPSDPLVDYALQLERGERPTG